MTDARRVPVGLTTAVALSFLILIGLGVWQVERMQWKAGLLAHVAALQSAPAGPLAPALQKLSRGEDVAFSRVRATCTGLARAPFLQLYAIKDGEAGVRLISACRLAEGPYGAVLVDRGFVPDTVSARPNVEPADPTPVEVVGVLRAPDRATFVTPANQVDANQWYSRDVAAMARTLSAERPAPLFLMAETSTNPEWKALDPAALPTDIPNRHLEYALTWFGLAAALVGVYAAVLLKRRKA